MLCSNLSFGQANGGYQLYAVHEDVVKPSMVMEYEAVTKEFKSVMDKYKNDISKLEYLAMSTTNFRYSFVWPIENMAELDNNAMIKVREKMGADKFDDMMARMDACYDSHTTYTIALDESLSYMPEGMSQTQEGMPYREFHYYYTTPENMAKLAKKGAALTAFHKEKKSNARYRVYRSGFGAPQAFFMVAISAKDPEDMARNSKQLAMDLGQEYQQMLMEALKYTSKYEVLTGWVRPDLSVNKD